MHRIVCDVSTGEIVQIPYTAKEEAEWVAKKAAYVPPDPIPEPTKQQLLAEVQGLLAKIEALK